MRSYEAEMPKIAKRDFKEDARQGDQGGARAHGRPASGDVHSKGPSERMLELLRTPRKAREGVQGAMMDLSKTYRGSPEGSVLQVVLASQEQIRSEINKLAQITAAQGAKIDAFEKRVETFQDSLSKLYEHNQDCPARSHWQGLREDLSEIRVMVGTHDRQLAEEQGFKAGRKTKPTPWAGLAKYTSSPPVAISLSIKDPKVWGKIIFYTAVAAAAAASLVAQYT